MIELEARLRKDRQTRIIFRAICLVFEVPKLIFILALAALGSRGIVTTAEYMGGQSSKIGPGLEMFLIAELMIILREQSKWVCLRIVKEVGLKHGRMKERASFKFLIACCQILLVIGSLLGIFTCYEGFHEPSILQSNESGSDFLHHSPISFSDPLCEINKYITLFAIAYAICIGLFIEDTCVSLHNCRKAISNKKNKRRKLKAQIGFMGYLMIDSLRIFLYGGFLYITSSVALKVLDNYVLVCLVVCCFAATMGTTLVLLGKCNNKCFLTPRRLLFGPWYLFESHLRVQYNIQAYLILPIIAFLFFKEAQPSQISKDEERVGGDGEFLEFLTITSLAVLLQVKLLLLEPYLRGEIRRANHHYEFYDEEQNEIRRWRVSNLMNHRRSAMRQHHNHTTEFTDSSKKSEEIQNDNNANEILSSV